MKRLPDPVQKINAWVLSLDLHKRITVWVLLDRRGHLAAEGQIPSRPEALRELLTQRIGRKKAHVAMEAGGNCFWAFDVCQAYFQDPERVHVAHPKNVRAIANSTQKNDRNDAWWLAYLTYEQRLPEVYIPQARYRELRIATRERTAFVRERTRAIKRVHAYLRQAGRPLRQGALKGGIEGPEIQAAVFALAGALRQAVEDLLEHIVLLTQRIQAWEAEIRRQTEAWEEVQVLAKALPGVGPILAAVIVAESGPIGRFFTAKAYGRYSGLVPSERSSAGQTRFGAICREGSSQLRWALTQAVMACRKSKRGEGVAVRRWVDARVARLGSTKKAVVAAARKLAEAVWRLFELGECFELERIFGRVPLEARRAS